MLFLKRNKFLIIFLCIVVLIMVCYAIFYKVDYNKSLIQHEVTEKYLKEHPEINVSLKDPYIMDTYSLFTYFLVDSPLSLGIFVFPFILMFVGSYNFYQKYKSGYFKYEQMREKYSKCISNAIFSSWKNCMIIPIYLIITFIVCYIISGHFDIGRTIEYYNYSFINRNLINNLPLYLFIYIINLTLLGLFCINISVSYIKKCDNFLVLLILSYLTYIIVWIITEVVIGNVILLVFPNLPQNFTMSLALSNFWVYEDIISLPFMILFAMILFLISLIVVILVYRNKEGVNIEMEK